MAAQEQPPQENNDTRNTTSATEGDKTGMVSREETNDETTGDFFSNETTNLPAQVTDNDVATNDGGIIETLDTALHDKPGLAEGDNISGSNRADYYESKSYGKTDSEEELDALNNRQAQ